MSDKTNPEHYKFKGFQVIQLTSQLGFVEGNIVKYVSRSGLKAGESRLDDLRKARWYLDRLIDKLEKDS